MASLAVAHFLAAQPVYYRIIYPALRRFKQVGDVR